VSFLLASLGLFIVMAPIVTDSLKSAPAAQMAQSIAAALSPLGQASREIVEPIGKQVLSSATAAQGMNRHQLHKAAPHATSHIRTAELVAAPKIDASAPVITVSVPQIAMESNPPATRPQPDAGDADLTICRPPQELVGSRLMGPEVCLPQREWVRIKRQGLLLLPDGRTMIAEYQKERILHPRTCTPSQFSATSAGAWTVSCVQ
jgi:hypothetical protein